MHNLAMFGLINLYERSLLLNVELVLGIYCPQQIHAMEPTTQHWCHCTSKTWRYVTLDRAKNDPRDVHST